MENHISKASNEKYRKFEKTFKWLKLNDDKPYCIHCYYTFKKFTRTVFTCHENTQAHKRAVGTWIQEKNAKPPKIRSFMGSSKGKKYDKSWEIEFKWLSIKDGQASCNICNCFFTTFKRHVFVVHEITQMHQRYSRELKKTPVSFPKRKPVQIFHSKALKEYEIKVSVCIACHSSMRDIDHISDIIKSFSKTELSGINLHRTKCTNIIKNVIGVAIWEELIEDLSGAKYSILIDSLEVLTSRYLCLCVKYFSKRHGNLRIEFLGFENLDIFSSESIFKATSLHLEKCNLDLKNCVSFSYIGLEEREINHFIVSHFRTVSPHVMFVRCLSQEFELCCKNAIKKLPSDVLFLLAEIFHWFKMTTPHKDYLNLFCNMNSGCSKPSETITSSHIHWLIIGKCISAVVDNWNELKAYFYHMGATNMNYYTCIINNMLCQDKYLAYFTIILPIVKEFENINISLSLANADVIKVYKMLDHLHKTLLRKIFKRVDRRSKLVSIKNFVLGSKLEKAILSMSILESERMEITENYFAFVVEVNNQLENCLSKTVFETLRVGIFHPQEFLNDASDFYEILRSVFLFVAHDFQFESIFDQIKKVNWKEIFPGNIELPTLESNNSDPLKITHTRRKRLCSSKTKPGSKEEETVCKKSKANSSDPSKKTSKKIPPPDPFWETVDPVKFWVFVRDYEQSKGDKLFSAFADIVLSIFSIPFNTAFTDCIKNHMSTIKNRLRNRTSLNTVEAILRIRMLYNNEETCCETFTVTPKMLSLFNKKIYGTQTSDTETVIGKIQKPMKRPIKRLSLGRPYTISSSAFKSEEEIPSSSRNVKFSTSVSPKIKRSSMIFNARTNISRSIIPSALSLNFHSNAITSPSCYSTTNLEQSNVISTWTSPDVTTLALPADWSTSSQMEINAMPSSSEQMVTLTNNDNLNMPIISCSTTNEIKEEEWKVIYAVI